MSIPAYLRRSYGGGAEPLVLAGELDASALTFTLANSDIGTVATWLEDDGNPLGTVGPFVVVIDRFTSSVEKILCSAINLSTGVVTVYNSGGNNGRGYDGTLAQDHVPGFSSSGVQVCASSIDLDEANQLVKLLLGNLGTSGQVPISTGTSIGWQSAPSPPFGSAPPSISATATASAAGSASTASRSDHNHGLVGLASYTIGTPVYGSAPPAGTPLKLITGLVTHTTDSTGHVTITWTADLGAAFATGIVSLQVSAVAADGSHYEIGTQSVSGLTSFVCQCFSGASGAAPAYVNTASITLRVMALGY